MCPGFTRSREFVLGSARTLIVRARSPALMPVVTPSRASTLTVNAVPSLASLRETICGRSSSCNRSAVIGTQMTPLAYLRMNATCSGPASSAAIVRSPSFSRSSSSTTMTIFPRRMSSIASATVANGPGGGTTLGRLGAARFTLLTVSSLGSRSRLLDEALDVLGQHVGFDVDEVARGERAQCRALGGVRDERDLEEGLAKPRDRQRYAVERDESLHHDVAGEAFGKCEAEAGRTATFLAASDQLAGRIDMSLHEVAAQRRRRRGRRLEIHARPADRTSERGPRERLRDEVDREPVRVAFHDREARARDVDARFDGQILRDARRRDLEPQTRRIRSGVTDHSDLPDDAGEHLAERSFQCEIVAELAYADVAQVARLRNALERGRSVAAGHGRQEEQHAIGETATHEGSGHVWPSLAHHRIHAVLPEPAEHGTEVEPAVGARS